MAATGNVRDYRDRGQLVIDASPADDNVPFATASFRGWHRDQLVGQGPSVEAAVADLRRITGVSEPAQIVIE